MSPNILHGNFVLPFVLSASCILSRRKSVFTPSSLKAIGTVLPGFSQMSNVSIETLSHFHSQKHPPWVRKNSTTPLRQRTYGLFPVKNQTIHIYVGTEKQEVGVGTANICCSSNKIFHTEQETLSTNTTAL